MATYYSLLERERERRPGGSCLWSRVLRFPEEINSTFAQASLNSDSIAFNKDNILGSSYLNEAVSTPFTTQALQGGF